MVDLEAGVLRIVDTTITKGGRDRTETLPVPGMLLRRLLPLIQAAAPRCPRSRIFPVQAHYVRWRVRQACRALGIEKKGTHGYRYRFANDRLGQLLDAGKGLAEAMREVSEAMGHSRPDVIRTYSNRW